MKRIRIFILVLICISILPFILFSQNVKSTQQFDNQVHGKNAAWHLSSEDSVALMSLPVLEMPDYLAKLDLPDNLDNSNQPYFRELFEQSSNECGQYSGIAFNFTYEIDYIRNVPANIPPTLYPTHYTFNFMNGGYGWHGASYLHSFEIVKTNGCPNEADYGGTATGGPSRWITGYNKYYNGMFNRIDEVYQMPVGTPEGLLTLKNWLHNHLEGDEIGGVASFCSDNPWNTTTLPPGTPEEGKHVIVSFGANAGHSSTICGWNDSIRYDYNSDGQYTTNVDINSDGIVNMKDWEIGGLLFTDSYNGGYNYADSGFCFMMYKTLADNVSEGGIWNHVVHVLKIKEDYSPLLTMKVKIKHTSRDKLKVVAGVSMNLNDIHPTHTLSFPIFNYQGGSQYMQGGASIEANKTIEFGLDVTPLLGSITSEETAKFFLQVYERDEENVGSGQIIDFSLMDYTGTLQEHECPQSNIPINDNSVTTLAVNANIDFNQLEITTNSLPDAALNEPYSYQLEASGGTQPYKWNLVKHYSESLQTGDMPQINDSELIPSNNTNGIAMQVLDFPFPFYGNYYDTIFVHVDGFIMFDDQVYPWPYMYDEQLMIKETRLIAPFLCRAMIINPDTGNGIWYEDTDTYSAFKWITSIESAGLNDVTFALLLYPSGKIRFYYGDDEIFVDNMWGNGISDGDKVNYKYPESFYKSDLLLDNYIKFTPEIFPAEMEITIDGLFSGIPQNTYDGIIIEFLVTDYNNIPVRKTFLFNCCTSAVYNEIQNKEAVLNVFPNPFKDILNIEFNNSAEANTSLNIYNLKGKLVNTLVDENIYKGHHHVYWNATDQTGIKLPNGVYFCILKSGNKTYTSKLVLSY